MKTRQILQAIIIPAALAAALAACAPAAAPSAARLQVEAVFDVPREYRVLSTLPCAEGAGLVYVVSAEGDLYSFRPDALELKHIGPLRCPVPPGVTPNSMAVDRAGTAWVNYQDGSYYRASTRDASCEATGYRPHQHGFGTVGMAFASTGADLMEETLFVWGGYDRNLPWHVRRIGGDRDSSQSRSHRPRPGLGLAKIERHTLQLLPIGDDRSRLSTLRAELTGTGDGKLFGFFSTNPATLAEIEVETGAIRSPRELASVSTGGAWAFSFWGGDFWFYWAPHGHTTNVSRLSGLDGSITKVLSDIGFRIVGAGVSTCAPTGPV